MYDEYARSLIELIPDLPDIDRLSCRRALSAAYFHVLRSSLVIERDDTSERDLRQVKVLLRGMIDALESVAVFDRLNGLERPAEEESASAFVAAEALSLLAMLLPDDEEPPSADHLLQVSNYLAVESALLYMIGGYDINAVSVVRHLEVPVANLEETMDTRRACIAASADVLSRIVALCRGEVRRPRPSVSPMNLPNASGRAISYELLLDELRVQFYLRMAHAIDAYLDWLGEYRSDGYENCINALNSLRDNAVSQDYPCFVAFADVYHLSSLLLAAIDQTSRRSLVHCFPRPTEGNAEVIEDMRAYIRHRARGDETHRGRPFLWPSASQYIVDCLPGPNRDAVVSMPTGSGKSFVAELATAHALCAGWVLYLVPTNALVHQVRRDLRDSLGPLRNVEIRSFIGWDEYTSLAEEQIDLGEARSFVAVMTPERCALAMRLYPERFADCSLCVFDECHLINDPDRGITADILLAQLGMVAPGVRFLLMSAMVSNPEELAEWLSSAHGANACAPTVTWRPSRTMRGLLVLDENPLNEVFQSAKARLERLPEHRVNVGFHVPIALIAGLSGPWTMDGPPDYRVARLPVDYEANATRRRGTLSVGMSFGGWKNAASRQVSELLARSKIPTLCFILSSRHHAFSGASKVSGPLPGAIGADDPFPALVEAWLNITEAELGGETALRALLRDGIAVHTSAMLRPEQAAAEWMFARRKALLMFATGTLAQGLNLPAVAVVIAGTSIGDPRFTDQVAGITRADALILNGFGRAGRPGFANQGLAILVSDRPFSASVVDELDPRLALEKYGVLGESGAAVAVHSPIEAFFDMMLDEGPEVSLATEADLTLTSLLAEHLEDDHSASQVLSRTLAAYHKRADLSAPALERIQQRIETTKSDYLQRPGVPIWMNTAAMKAGVSFWRAWRMWQAYQERGSVTADEGSTLDVREWLDVFMATMALLPPNRVQAYLADEGLRLSTVLTRLRDQVIEQVHEQDFVDTVPWEMPDDWLALWQELGRLVSKYMHGATYAEIARSYLGLPSDAAVATGRSSGSQPIPRVFGFLRKVVYPLAIDAGCFLAIQEFSTYGDGGDVPETLQSLPLCIRNGCDSVGTLAWFRFAYRQRTCAHAFEAAFPVPRELRTDQACARWVKQTRRRWLSGELTADGYPILGRAMTVIKEGGAM